jgi:oligopeptidase A
MTNSIVTDSARNPLLIGQGLPPFAAIQPEHVVPAMTQLLAELEQELTQLEAEVQPVWSKLVEPLQQIGDRLEWSWGIVSHLLSVKNSPELREAHETMQPAVVEFYNRLSQSQPIYRAYQALRDSDAWATLEPAQQRIVEAAIRDAELSGIGLPDAERETFNAIVMELSALSTKFSNHLLDATKAFRLTLTQPDQVEGLPPSLLAQAAQAARAAGDETATPETGPWQITLDFPAYLPFMKYSKQRDLRETLYRASISRASSGEFNNNPLIERILELRQKQAQLLGFENYAKLSLKNKMAERVEAVEQLLEELRSASYDAAVQEVEELKAFAAEQGAAEANDLQNWDLFYWSERRREAEFDFTDEELRPYFALPQVLEGLFALVNRLFGVTVKAADGQAPIWHEDVRYFDVVDESGEVIAHFYLDPYSRPAEKQGGAWMNPTLNRAKINGQIRLPITYLVCNQSPPVDGKPSLMSFTEVTTLFHEFGHGVHHMLTQVDYPWAAGISNVEFDAVELPSQFLENWCYERMTLMGMAKHYQTGESLPEPYDQKLLAARNYMTGYATLRQLHFSFLDMELHDRYQPGGPETIAEVRSRLAKTTTVLPPLAEDHFLCSFGHIFAGPYAAGYYGYKWAEVLSADAFAAFEEAGLDNQEAIARVGRRYRDTVLALGGSQHPSTIFKAFRGRPPSTEPLLRQSGLLK